MSKKIIFLLLSVLLSLTTYAQKVRGFVQDEDKKPLPSATITINGTSYSTLTNEDGEFHFNKLPLGQIKITASFIGYKSETKTINITDGSRQTVKFDLEPDNSLAEIEVFGERFKQPEKLDLITRMPLRPSEQIQSISVISDKVITEQGALTITDAVRNVPGVTLFGSYGGTRESMSSRGFRGIPVLKNGVRIDSQFQTAAGITDMQGVESIQMIKGSAAVTQGVITDLGNAGGVINVVTKTPKFVNAGEVSFRAGSWGEVRPTFDVQSVLDSKKTVAFRINGAYERADNYRPIVSSDRIYINPSLEWRPDDKTSIILEMDYLNANNTPVTSTVNLADISTDKLYDMPHDKFLGFKGENNNAKVLTYSARVNRKIADKLSLKAGFFNSSYDQDNTSSALSEVTKGSTEYNMKKRTLSRSLRDDKNSTFQVDFVGQDIYTGTLKHTFQVGFDFRIADATTTNKGSALIDTINVLSSNISHNLPKDYKLEKPGDPVESKYTTYGLMAQEVLTINKYLKAILGLRYSSINVTQPSPKAGVDRRHAWDPMVGIMISPIENVNLFASYTTSTSLRSAANILTDSVTEAGPSKTKQFEAGIKSDWLNNKLRFNFTYFHIITENLTNSEYIEGTTQTTGYFFKAGDLVRDGFEVELNGRILDNLQVMLGYAYLNARYKDSPSYVNGSAPMNAPKHTANAWAYYTVNKGAAKGLSIGAGVYYVGKRPVNEFSNAYDGHLYNPGVKPFDMPAYTTVNAQLAYNIGKVTARVFFNNIFDALGYNSYYRGGYINQIDPRNFAASLSYKF